MLRLLVSLWFLCATVPALGAGLVDSLVTQLGVTPAQASGGAGALLAYAQHDLNHDDWTQLTALVPEADALAQSTDLGRGVMSSLGSVLGDDNLTMAKVAEQFQALGLDATTVSQFAPVILDYLNQHGGEDLVAPLADLWIP
ncbi:DUF2780 domain-containing protein [Ferrimonas balearica]|uniref:DUF2780 domain-containing protein n=1 Tax=Ferrimonas balearica TaxID=44012 RepID=UPI001C996A0D|nr:DUF2780 domain-containing protein [Ferrimonas balearica]MBY5992172.1 DUF2780 domain-containing protein [Ferrimonas balearica]